MTESFLVGRGKGWLTAEYAMLPGSTKSSGKTLALGRTQASEFMD